MLENPVPAAPSTATILAAATRPQVPLAVDVNVVLESAFAFTQFQEQVGDVLARGLPLSVVITGLDQRQDAIECFTRVSSGVAAAAGRYATSPRDIEVALPAGAMLPNEAWAARCEHLQKGPLYLLAGEHELRIHPDQRPRFRQFWEQLWQLQPDRHVRLACAPLVRSVSPLLAHETGATVLPRSAIQVPVGSAWIRQTIDLRRFADTRGVLDRTQLRTELQRSIDAALAFHEPTDWPNACLRHDSWLNRRLAIVITGIGDLVVRRRQDPRELASLASLRRTLHWIRSLLLQRSRDLALAGDTLPAITRFDSVHGLGVNRERWEARYSAAITEHACASRNLLVMSPWSVFPTQLDADPAYLNLLPLLDFADACAFPEPPQLRGWNIKHFMQLHQRTWAILERRGDVHRFAERV